MATFKVIDEEGEQLGCFQIEMDMVTWVNPVIAVFFGCTRAQAQRIVTQRKWRLQEVDDGRPDIRETAFDEPHPGGKNPPRRAQ